MNHPLISLLGHQTHVDSNSMLIAITALITLGAMVYTGYSLFKSIAELRKQRKEMSTVIE